MARADQHPFTPEPRVPEPWPGPREIPSGWVWDAEGDGGHMGEAPERVVIHPADLKRVKAHERAERRKWRERGFSIGFGSYS